MFLFSLNHESFANAALAFARIAGYLFMLALFANLSIAQRTSKAHSSEMQESIEGCSHFISPVPDLLDVTSWASTREFAVFAPQVVDGFDFPVGQTNGTGWLNNLNGLEFLQQYNYGGSCGLTYHPGHDFNKDGTTGDDDRYEPVYAVAEGTVVASAYYGTSTWGNVILIQHNLPDGSTVWSQYGHLEDRWVANGATVTKRQQIGRVGKGDGSLAAHLHFEVRKVSMGASAFPCGESQAYVNERYHNPINFINTHRSLVTCQNGTATMRNRDNGPPIHPPGSVLRTASNQTVYLIDADGRKRPLSQNALTQLYPQSTDIRSSTNFNNWVVIVGQDELDLYEEGGSILAQIGGNGKPFPDGKFIVNTGNNNEISIVTGIGRRRPFSTATSFTGLGFDFDCATSTNSGISNQEYTTEYPAGAPPTPVDAMVLLISSVNLSTGPYIAGQSITGSFTIKNVGYSSITMPNLGIGGRFGSSVYDMNFVSRTLAPGESYTYTSQPRQLTSSGTYEFFAAYQENNGDWTIRLPANPGVVRSRQITVSGGSPTPTNTPTATPTSNPTATPTVTPSPGSTPVNNQFSNSTLLSGNSTQVNGTNVNATKEAGEPNHAGNAGGASVWYRWTPSASGTVTIDTIGSNYDTLLAAYIGSSVSGLTEIASNDDITPGSNLQSRIQFAAVAGTTYRIAVDGYNNLTGSVVIPLGHSPSSTPTPTVTPTNTPTATPTVTPSPGSTPVNNQFSSSTLLSGNFTQVNGSNINATEAGEPNHANNVGGASVWYRWTPTSSGRVTINTATSSFDTLLAAYTGTGVSGLTTIAFNDDVDGTLQSRIEFDAFAGTTYRIAIDGFNNGINPAFTGSILLTVSHVPASTPTPTNTPTATPTNTPTATPTVTPSPSSTPVNNQFSSSTLLSGNFTQVNGSNINATKEAGEPNHANNVGGASVWYRWTPTSSGRVTINTATSSFDTLLAAYTGTGVSGLTTIAFNDDVDGTLQSRIEFDAFAGTTYRIAIDGFNNGINPAFTGSILLTVSHVPASTPTPTNTPTATPTNMPTATPTNMPTPTPTNTPTATPTVTPTPMPTGTPPVPFDYDGDRKADVSVYRPSTGIWYLDRSQSGIYGIQFGLGTDKVVPADYDGDGRFDVAVYRPSTGVWYWVNSETLTFAGLGFGAPGDIPVPGDYDGDGRADQAVFRPSTGQWWLNRTRDGVTVVSFGVSGDHPVVGDYDGDGRADQAIFRPSTGVWWLNRSTDGVTAIAFGFGTDKVVPADYDNDGKTDVAVYRPSTGIWYWANSGSLTYGGVGFGAPGDIPAAGDYDGDGRADPAIYRPSTGTWWLNRTTAGITTRGFGLNGDIPTQNAYGN